MTHVLGKNNKGELMNEKVLNTIRHSFGGSLTDEEGYYDADLIIHINTVLMVLSQMGVVKPNSKIDKNTTWDEIMDSEADSEGIKTYIYLKVRLLFDPPTNSGVTNAINESIKELEWRLYSFNDEIGKP